MALLELYIGKSKYVIDSEESQKAKILALAKKVNEKVNELSLKMRDADEKTILMLCAIMIEEDLQTEQYSKMIQSTKNDNQQPIPNQTSQKELENISLKIETLANKIKKY